MTNHDTLVQQLTYFLSSSESLKRKPLSNTTKVITTHISTVILVGDYAYKLKRPVHLPFLDYSTPAKRHAACIEEYEVNQRTAPELYLGVRPVLESSTQISLGTHETDHVLEWLVLMRRFPPHQLLSDYARQDRLSFDHIVELSVHVSEFHARCRPLTKTETQEDAPTQHWLLESLQEIYEQRHDPETRTQLEMLQGWVQTHQSSIQTLQQERLNQGKVRDCHGDMHLGNITFYNNKVMAFDAIDFNPALRRIDVIDEVAFIFMDLCAHRLLAHAWHFLNSYLHRTGDYHGIPLLEYYIRYRAVVRAKVSLLNKLGNAAFQRYWMLACSPNLRTFPSQLILISGLSGSGKSTVARLLSQQLGAVWLRADVERKRLYPNPAQRYTPQASVHTYQRLAKISHDLLMTGCHVIVDATFQEQTQIDIFESCVDSLHSQGVHVQAQTLVCQASFQTMQTRITQRLADAQDPSEATPDVLRTQYQKQLQHAVHWSLSLSIIHNESSLENLQAQLEHWLEQRHIDQFALP